MPPASIPAAEQLYQGASCGLALAEANGDLLAVNDIFCSWVRQRADELVGRRRFPDLLSIGGRIFWQTHVQPLLRMQGTVAEVKLELVREHLAPVPVILNIAERAWEGRKLLHISVVVAEDRHRYERELLAQRTRAEELLEQHARDQEQVTEARSQAEDRARFAEQLVGIVSHDIRNPLSVIRLSAHLLERGVAPAQQKQAVARIARAVDRMQHLIADLLDFSQARLGRGLSIAKRSCDLQQAIADAVAELAIAFPDARLEHQRAGSAMVEADPERITQAVGNLVANAVNHGARGEPVTVRSEADATRFRISVHNHGKPIPPELVPLLFEPMVRGEEPGASKGVGLGLYIVREIARGHGGQVEASSGPEGTTFTITIPCGGAAA
jgi:phosphoserine phosphatase RsbU/P